MQPRQTVADVIPSQLLEGPLASDSKDEDEDGHEEDDEEYSASSEESDED